MSYKPTNVCSNKAKVLMWSHSALGGEQEFIFVQADALIIGSFVHRHLLHWLQFFQGNCMFVE